MIRTLRRAAALSLCLIAGPVFAASGQWEDMMQGALALKSASDEPDRITLGFGLGYVPDYVGSDEYQLYPLPLIDVEYRDTLFVSTARGLGYNFVKRKDLKMGVRATIDYGRDAQENQRTKTLADVDVTYELGVFSEYYYRTWRSKFDFRKGVNGHEGLIGSFDLARGGRISENTSLVLGGRLRMADEAYMNAYYGVPKNNLALRRYEPSGGFHDVSFYADYIYEFTTKLYMSFDIRITKLMSDPAGSPATQQDTQLFLGTVLAYRF
ncbi:MAG: MipA/OmpV family protein [Alphaproteobacteria bacterium]|nr:MipA/OmpV family protein [Alphaproteobacteria bacterium]